jgi:hypothetical protein
MANNKTNVSDFVIGLGILDLYKIEKDEDIYKITKRVQETIKKDDVMKKDHTITKNNPKLIQIIKTEYDMYMNEKKENEKKYQEFQKQMKKDLQRFLSEQNYKNKPIQSIENPIVVQNTFTNMPSNSKTPSNSSTRSNSNIPSIRQHYKESKAEKEARLIASRVTPSTDGSTIIQKIKQALRGLRGGRTRVRSKKRNRRSKRR